MKNISKILMSVGVLALMFTACSEDFPERTPSYLPEDGTMQVYFPKTNKSALEVETVDTTVSIMVSRVDSTSGATIGLTEVSDPDNVFTVPANIKFVPGQKNATVVVKFPLLTFFKKYTLEIKLQESYTNPYTINTIGTTSFILKVTQSDWVDYATGTYKSDFFEDEWAQTLKFSNLLKRYKFSNLWADGYDCSFTWDGSSVVVPIGTVNSAGLFGIPTGYIHSKYGMVTAATDSSSVVTFYTPETKTFKFEREWTVALGSFGFNSEYFTIEEVL